MLNQRLCGNAFSQIPTAAVTVKRIHCHVSVRGYSNLPYVGGEQPSCLISIPSTLVVACAMSCHPRFQYENILVLAHNPTKMPTVIGSQFASIDPTIAHMSHMTDYLERGDHRLAHTRAWIDLQRYVAPGFYAAFNTRGMLLDLFCHCDMS
jgi:hypothetical protein